MVTNLVPKIEYSHFIQRKPVEGSHFMNSEFCFGTCNLKVSGERGGRGDDYAGTFESKHS